MITEADRQELAVLAMRALDRIVEDYGDDAVLCAASLVFEVQAPDEDGEPVFHANYESLSRCSPHHIGGLLHAASSYILSPDV